MCGVSVSRFTQKNLLRVYPKATRFNSSNYKPLTGWLYGAQLLAFNMQVWLCVLLSNCPNGNIIYMLSAVSSAYSLFISSLQLVHSTATRFFRRDTDIHFQYDILLN